MLREPPRSSAVRLAGNCDSFLVTSAVRHGVGRFHMLQFIILVFDDHLHFLNCELCELSCFDAVAQHAGKTFYLDTAIGNVLRCFHFAWAEAPRSVYICRHWTLGYGRCTILARITPVFFVDICSFPVFAPRACLERDSS